MAQGDTCKRCGHDCHCIENNPHNECSECLPKTDEGNSCPICGCQDPVNEE